MELLNNLNNNPNNFFEGCLKLFSKIRIMSFEELIIAKQSIDLGLLMLDSEIDQKQEILLLSIVRAMQQRISAGIYRESRYGTQEDWDILCQLFLLIGRYSSTFACRQIYYNRISKKIESVPQGA